MKMFYSSRPDQTSYLYFMNFAASVLEHTVETAEVFVSTFFNVFGLGPCFIICYRTTLGLSCKAKNS